MQLRLRVLAVLSTSILVAFGAAQAQTPGSGTVTINGSEQGPIYPCGNTSCPTYDSGQITITVNGFNASTKYSHAGGQKTSHQPEAIDVPGLDGTRDLRISALVWAQQS